MANFKIIAFGDSWFHYPHTQGNVIYYLKKNHFPDINYKENMISVIAQGVRNHPASKDDNVGENGEDLRNMAFNTKVNHHGVPYQPTWLEILLGRLSRVQEDKIVMLLSGGGNDIVGEELMGFLNHAQSGLPILREESCRDFIHNGLKTAYEKIVQFTESNTSGKEVHFIFQGYAHPPVNGKGVTGLNHFVGPWIQPYFIRNGVYDRHVQEQTINRIIDIFNEMLISFVAAKSNCHYLDLRPLINQRDEEWCNELHLNAEGFAKVAAKFAECINNLPWQSGANARTA